MGFFSLGWACYVTFFFFFSDFSSKIFLGFFCLLESPNILLSRANYGAKFNFIGIKKIEGVSIFFFLKGTNKKF